MHYASEFPIVEDADVHAHTVHAAGAQLIMSVNPIALGVDGHRADITLIKTAQTLAAVAGHTEVNREDLREAAKLALPHRMRRRPFEEQSLNWDDVDKVIDE